MIKFIYSEKATKFCEISTLLLSYVVPFKSKVEISQNFVAFSEYMNFTIVSNCIIVIYSNLIEFRHIVVLDNFRQVLNRIIHYYRSGNVCRILRRSENSMCPLPKFYSISSCCNFRNLKHVFKCRILSNHIKVFRTLKQVSTCL